MISKSTLIFCSAIAFGITRTIYASSKEIGFPIIRNYTPREYSNYPQVLAAIQDNRGIMYFGVGGGILEYDGVSWRNITEGKQTKFLDFAIDKSGKIYVAALDEFGYLKTDKKGNTIYQTLTQLLLDSTYKIGFVWSIKLTSKFAYFITYDDIFQYSPDNEKLLIFKPDANDGFLDGFVYKDILYVQFSKKGLMKLENGELKPAVQSEFFMNKNIFRTALPFNSNTLLIPTRTDGLCLYQPEKDTIPSSFSLSNNDFLLDNNIYNASLFQKDYFVLASINKGALLFDKQGKVLQQYNENNLLQNNTVRVIMTDTSQNLWLGLDNGISKTDYRLDLSYWNKNAGLKGSVYSVIRFNGTVYIATSIKLYFINENNQVQEVKNIPVGQNWCFLENKNNNSLLVGMRYGIYEIKGDSATLICNGTHSAKLFQSIKNPNRVFSSFLPDFISIRFEAGKWIYEGKWAGIKDEIRGIMEDENGEVWLGTFRNGVIRVTPNNENITNPKKIRYYTQKDGFASLSDILPFKYKNKIVWGTEKGLYIYNPETDRFDPFCELGKVFCNGSRSVYSIIEMTDGKIWICPRENKKGDIGYLQPNSNGGYDWVYAPFRQIPEMLIESFYIESPGIAWVGGTEGLFRYDMSKDSKNYKQSFNCLIRKVTAGKDSTIYGGNTTTTTQSGFETRTELDYRFNSLKFEFAAPFFDQEEKTLYCYKLAGYENEWSKWSQHAEKEYTNLNEGTYTFQVKARNVYDVESEVSTFQITIHPPIYRTWWAYSLYIILLALFIYIIVKLYTQLLRKQKEHLKQVVKERTVELFQQKEELQATNEELQTTLQSLKETQKQLIQSEKMASLGVLASGVAHEINNPLNFIQGGVLGIEQYFEENPDENKSKFEFYLTAISEGVKRAEEIVSRLNHFSRTGNIITEKIDIHLIINNCLLILQNSTKNRIEIIKNYTSKPYALIGNESKLHQVMLNILTNAVQAINGKGVITINTEIEDWKLKISVSDTGCGISEENLPRILDPFFTTKDPGKGIGLGLSITYNIIQEHNGKIDVKSEPGKGSEFIVTIPIKQE